MINLLRRLVGVAFVGPIGGMVGYFLFNPMGLIAGIVASLAVGMAAIVAGSGSVISFSILSGALVHIGTGILMSMNQYNAHQNVKDSSKSPEPTNEDMPPSPIARGFYIGFCMANAASGKDNHPYGKKAIEIVEMIEGAPLTFLSKNSRTSTR